MQWPKAAARTPEDRGGATNVKHEKPFVLQKGEKKLKVHWKKKIESPTKPQKGGKFSTRGRLKGGTSYA